MSTQNIVEQLNTELARTYSLSLAAKQAHWNVEGENFMEVHELLDKVSTQLREVADELAERVSALGSIPIALAATLAGTNISDDFPIRKITTKEALSLFSNYLRDEVSQLADLAKSIGDTDLITQDICIEAARSLAKTQWFLASHLGN